jgi:hypothetical protein
MVAQLTAEGAYAPATKKQQEEIRDAYEAYYKQQMGSTGGYQQGLQTIAPLTADQLAANQGLRGLVGSQDALRQEGVDLTRGTTRQYTPSGKPIEEYMSPYLRTALDAQKQQAQRQYERTSVPQFEAQAVAAGGMSGLGSRAGVEAAERATGQNMLLANIEASGQQKAYEAAVEAQLQDQKQDQMMFKNQLARETDAAAALGASASNIYKGKASEYGLLSQMGKEGQQFDERNLEDAERRRLEEYNFPLQQLNTYAGGIAGVTPNRNQAQIVPKQGGPSWGTIAGSLATKYIAPKVADWFGSYFGAKAGGQIPSPPASIAPAQFQNNFLEKTNSPPMYNNTVAQPLGGLSSTMQAQPFMNISREGGGPVMPPMYYRAVGGQTAPMMNPTMMDQAQAQPLGGLSSTMQDPRQVYEQRMMEPSSLGSSLPPISPPVMPPTPATGLPSVIPSQAEQNAAVSDGRVTSFGDYDQAEKDLQLKAAVDKFKEGYNPSAVSPATATAIPAIPAIPEFQDRIDVLPSTPREPEILGPNVSQAPMDMNENGGLLSLSQLPAGVPANYGKPPNPLINASFKEPSIRPLQEYQSSIYGGSPTPLGDMFNMGLAPQGASIGGLSSTPQAQPFGNMFTRQAGGPVMPPVVYRQESGLVDPEKTIQRIELEKLIKEGMVPRYGRGGDKTAPEKSPTLGEVLDSLPKYKARESVGVINPTTGKIEMPPAKSLKKQATATAPAMKDSIEVQGGQYTENEAALAMANDEAANTSGLAFKEQTLRNAIGTAKTQGPDAIETLRNAYKKYDETMKGTVETSAARTQAFWDQMALAIARGGDFKTNLVEGFAKGQASLAAMDKEEKAQTRASAGRELSTEEKVANILASRSKTRQEQLKELARLRITLKGAEKVALTKQINAMKNKQYTAYLKKYNESPDELEKSIKKVIDASNNPNKALQNKALAGVDEDNIVGDIGEIMIKQGKTQLEATKIYIKNLTGN